MSKKALSQIVFLGIAPFLVGNFKPKVLYVIGQSFSTIAIGALGIYVCIQNFYPEFQTVKYFGWIPFASMLVVVVMRGTAVFPILYLLMSEMFPTEIRALSIGKYVMIF